MIDQVVLYWAGWITAVLIALGMLWKLVKPLCDRVHSAIDSWDSFMRDWSGEPEQPGRSAVPGVMERLNRIDGELKRNGGSSMKDAVNRIEKKLSQIDARLEEGNRRFEELEEKVK